MLQSIVYVLSLLSITSLGLLAYGFYGLLRNPEADKKKAKTYAVIGGVSFPVSFLLILFLGSISSGLGGVTLSGDVSSRSYDGMYVGNAVMEVAPASLYPSMPPGESFDGGRGVSVNYEKARVTSVAGGRVTSSLAPIMPPQNPAPVGEAKIVKNADLSLLVKSVSDSVGAINAVRAKYGGQPGNAYFSENGAGTKSGTITLWVPSDKFDLALSDIKALALRVYAERISTEDVSAEFVDATARLATLRSAETQLLEIMKRAGKISEILEVQRELNMRRTEIEQIQGRLNYLSHRVEQSSITVTLSEEVIPSSVGSAWRPLGVVKESAKSALKDMTDFVDFLIRLIGRLPGLILNLALLGAVFFGLLKVGAFLFRKMKAMSLPK